MTPLARLISWLNGGMNALFGLLREPMRVLPAWLSLTVISALLGVVLLILFKFTSHQTAISRIRDKIKARLLAIKLFKDNIPVVLKSQVQIFAAAVMLLIYSIPPMLVMILPFCLVLGQLGVWYQARPLKTDEQAVVVMQLAGLPDDPVPQVLLDPTAPVQIIAGPVRVPSKRQIFWQIQPTQDGVYQLQFNMGQTQVQKELTVGSERLPVSIKRPSLEIADLILYPVERPFNKTSPVRWIRIDYPNRTSLLTGSGVWLVTLLVISMGAAFLCKPFFRVNI